VKIIYAGAAKPLNTTTTTIVPSCRPSSYSPLTSYTNDVVPLKKAIATSPMSSSLPTSLSSSCNDSSPSMLPSPEQESDYFYMLCNNDETEEAMDKLLQTAIPDGIPLSSCYNDRRSNTFYNNKVDNEDDNELYQFLHDAFL